MGLQHRNRPIFGAQWHPESVCSEYGQQIVDNFRNVVLDFWAGRGSWASSTLRTIINDACLPHTILDTSAIIREAREFANAGCPHTDRSQERESNRAYYVKSVALGKGLAAQRIFDNVIRSTSLDGEAWLDSARVSGPHFIVKHVN